MRDKIETKYGGCEITIDHADIMVKAPDGDLAFFSSMASVRRWVKRKRKALLTASVAALLLCSSASAANPPHLKLWLCVHRQERTAWNDPNPPYLGGLQVGTGWFVPHYMRLVAHPAGMPNEWTPLQQMWFAERAYRYEHYSHGWLWTQWPPSRGVCF